MKNYFLSFLFAGILISCGGSEEDSSSSQDDNTDENVEEFTPPDCPSSAITLTYNEWSSETDEVVSNDYSFEVTGSAGYLENGRLTLIIGDAPNEDDMDIYDYLDTTHACVQITLDDAAEGEYNVLDSHTPIQPYLDGRSLAYFGSTSAFPDGKASGTVSITNLLDEWICGRIDMQGYHGGLVQGDFSVKLRSKY